MKIKFLLFAVLGFSQLTFAAKETPPPPPLDPIYQGVHNMVLMNKNSTILAYHLPTYDKPSNFQLIYQLSVKDVALVQLVRDAELVTIKTEPFNIQRLMLGEEVTIKAQVYIGHFAHEGMLVYKDMEINFTDKLYLRELNDLQSSSKQQEYDVVGYGDNPNDKLYVHRIGLAPSYDHIIHIDQTASCLKTFKTSAVIPTESELNYKFINCGTMKPLYFDVKSFLEKKDF